VPHHMQPHEALAARYPAVADTWHPDRNGTATPENTSAKNSYAAWWRCPTGHEWQEVVATRTGLPAWKSGNRAACRVCVGYHVIVAFDRAGRTARWCRPVCWCGCRPPTAAISPRPPWRCSPARHRPTG
jgi:hypothetical protein